VTEGKQSLCDTPHPPVDSPVPQRAAEPVPWLRPTPRFPLFLHPAFLPSYVSTPLFPALAANLVSVSELNRRVRALLENQFETLWVAGELSNVKKAPSGHWYFCLKDASAQIDCAMFASRAQFLDFRPENGQQVEVRARVTLYEPRGSYQLAVQEIRRAGLGALYEAFEKLKAKLQDEGLFDEAAKKAIPAFPRAIGIVTSPAAAALRDVLTTLQRRAPMVPVIVYPAQVQGEFAAAQIARAIAQANARAEVDVLIVCRGGGSLEDLWPFNEESVARAIAASRLPVVSGIGHETDFSIADFVADLRAPTPTAAAAAASPDRAALSERVAALRRRAARDIGRILDNGAQRLDRAARRLLTPAERIERNRERLRQLLRRMRFAGAGRTRERERHLVALRAALSHLDPTQVLERGYSIVRDSSGHVRTSSAGLEPGSALDVTFSQGGAGVTVVKPR
jgi:exodeoxyribonuclease VII large subunit